MNWDYHVILGVIAALLGIVGYALYFRSIFKGVTRPHFFTWFVYFLIDIIVFAAQVIKGAGPGAWVTLTGVIGTLLVSITALRYGRGVISKIDWVFFISALGAIIVWQATDNPLYAVIIATVINFLAVVPTIRKSYVDPYHESISIWLVDVIRYSFGIFAIVSMNLTTVLFPVGLVTIDAILIAIILIRRRELKYLEAAQTTT